MCRSAVVSLAVPLTARSVLVLVAELPSPPVRAPARAASSALECVRGAGGRRASTSAPAGERAGISWRAFLRAQAQSMLGRLLHRGNDLAAAPARPLLHRTRQPPRLLRWLHRQPNRRLGDPAGTSTRLDAPGAALTLPLPDPRPRQQVHARLRRRLRQRER